MAAMDGYNEYVFYRLVEMLRSNSARWQQRLDTDAQGFGLLLVPIVDQDIKAFVEKLLDYTKIFPSIFAAVQHKKWLADFDKSRVRDTTSNRSRFRTLVNARDDVLISVLGDAGLRARLQILAREFDMLDDLNSIVPTPGGGGTTRTSQSPHNVNYSPQSITLSTPDVTQQSADPTATPYRAYQPKQDLDIIWSAISKLEEHVAGYPAFDAQMEHLRRIAQAAMIPADEGGRIRPNLLKHTAAIRPTAQATLEKPRLQIDPDPWPQWNITVDKSGNIHLLELNLSGSANGRSVHGTWRSQLPDARYIPPEVITLPPEDGETDPNPKRSDVYAFTFLIYEASYFRISKESKFEQALQILSGIAPWDQLDIPSIVSQVTRGNRPGRPSPSAWLDNDNFWALLQRGWHQQPENRPDMALYTHELEHWQRVLKKTQDDHIFGLSQQPTSPKSARSYSFPRSPGDTNIMDDLSFDISREVKMVSPLYAPFAHGGFCDIFIGRRGLEKVAMKRLRIATIGDEDVVRKANILIKENGQAVLADFGLSKTMNAHTSHGLKDTGTGPYMAPELFAHCNCQEVEIDAATVSVTKTLETDVFAFGRTAIETPYGNVAGTPTIWALLLKGKRPARPATPPAKQWITDAMWTFINEMTHVQSECRPTMREIVTRLGRFCLELDPQYGVQSPVLEEEYDAGPCENTDEDTESDDGVEEGFQSPDSVNQIRAPNTRPPRNAQAKGILKPASQAAAPLKLPRVVQFANDPITTVE
ncbi:Receptor-interacting serine/threonine-protein kinase 2 [Ceratobasidium sp. 370]|nr:Receptor-interacting serine/threonine-protein kinase 2 [Ceratobasidium sp. 370]